MQQHNICYWVLCNVFYYDTAQVVLRELQGFVVGPTVVRDVWRCAGAMPGALCVMTFGGTLMLV